MTDDDTAKLIHYQRLSSVFTPGAPISNRDLFAGRLEQVLQVTSALNQPGKHVVLHGERGVGKTSLANLLSQFLVPIAGDERVPSARVNCTTQDTFKSIWTKVARDLRLSVPEEWSYQTPDPDEVRFLLSAVKPPSIVILDEYDRVEDDDSLSLMADTIKALSDHIVETKVVIVGVADSIDQLIGEHESVQRAIDEVLMPRMSEPELFDVIDNGLKIVGMKIDIKARSRIARLAEGLPHYVHLLTLNAAQRAVLDDRKKISVEDANEAIKRVVERHSLLREYQTAIQSPRPDNLFSRVLASCALAEKNRLGYFTASAVREPMSRIMGRQYDIPAFAAHLKAFTEPDRGSVLRREGTERRYTYRFRNPLLQPFAVLMAISDGLMPEAYREQLFG
jgi:Cdc6-like AAA superfamily ATPase